MTENADMICHWMGEDEREYRLMADWDDERRNLSLECRDGDSWVRWGLDWRILPALHLLADRIGTRKEDAQGGFGSLLKKQAWHGGVQKPTVRT